MNVKIRRLLLGVVSANGISIYMIDNFVRFISAPRLKSKIRQKTKCILNISSISLNAFMYTMNNASALHITV